MLKKINNWINNVPLLRFVSVLSALNFVLYHYPFFKYVFEKIDYTSFSGMFMVVSLIILMFVANAFAFYLLFFISKRLGKFLLVLFFLLNAIALYFVNTYGIIVDESMIGNVLNTNYEESSSFFSFKMLLYVIFLGVLPAVYVLKANIIKPKLKRFLLNIGFALLFMVVMVFANGVNWLWIDDNSKYLGGLAMPWSYTVNTTLFYAHKHQQNRKEILLPDAKIANDEKSVVVLVIGESARSQNFSLYGYAKNTNPLLSKTENVFHFPATSCATYTTAAVKCILEHQNTDDLYEVLPNYLHRNDVEVIWRTTNSGEPPIHIEKYQKARDLRVNCQGEDCDYDGILVHNLKEQILSSPKNKVLLILHTSTSHGPTYNKKYPSRFEHFKPVCTSVELANCSSEELINAYDNTIVYTDYILHSIIQDLKQLIDYKSTMIYVSDHGESLGEKNLYMHGSPMIFAPKEQYEIPFIVWVCENSKSLKSFEELSQHHVFHSVMDFLAIESPIYNEQMSIFD